MDPRQARTRRELRSTIYRLAAEKPIAAVTMAEIAREAGVTRDTVYRHAPSPVDLLADFLGEEIDTITGSLDLPAQSGTELSVFDDSERALLEHVLTRAAIYRGAMSPRLASTLRDLLVDRIEHGLAAHLARHPHIAPLPEPGVAEDTHRRLLVAYAATGTVGAIEEWLREVDARLDPRSEEGRAAVAAAARTVIAASPSWWLGRAG
jgi:AcrR family transcriptional regulator